jgi:hypothetical protein
LLCRWCAANPDLEKNRQKLSNSNKQQIPWNVGKKYKCPKISEANSGNKNYNWGKHPSDETRKKLSEKALASKHRRLLRSMRPYITKNNEIIILDSSWEEALAIRLDEININWIRPKEPFIYIDKNNKNRNYFPDFYLPDFDIFLDPKNPFCYKVQIDKIVCLEKQMSNLLILKDIESIRNYTPVIS